MSELNEGHQEGDVGVSEETGDIADFVRERYSKLSPQEASGILRESRREDGHVAVRSLLAHYQGPFGKEDLEKLLEIVNEEPCSFEAEENQRAIAAAAAEKFGGQLSEPLIDQLVEYASFWEDGDEMLLPLVGVHGVSLPRQRFVRMLQIRGKGCLKSELLRQHADSFKVEDVDRLIATEVENKAQAVEDVEREPDLFYIKQRYQDRPGGERHIARETTRLVSNRQRPSQEVLASIVKFIPVLQSRQFDSLAEEGDSVVRRELALRHGEALEEAHWQVICQKTRSGWILEAVLEKEAANKEVVEILLDDIVEKFSSVYDSKWGTGSGKKFLAEVAKHLQPQHVKTLVERGHALFVFNYIAGDYPEKLSASRGLLLAEHGKDIPSWWIQKEGGSFQPEEVEMLIESCLKGPMADEHYSVGWDRPFDRPSGLVAVMAEHHPDKLPEDFDKISILLKHLGVVGDVAEWVRQTGPDFEPRHVDQMLEAGYDNREALAWLIHHYPEKLSPDQYGIIKEGLLNANPSYGNAERLIKIAGAQLLEKFAGLVGEMLPDWKTRCTLASFIEDCPQAFSDEDMEELLGSPDHRIVRELVRHGVFRLDAPQIDRLIDMIWKRDDDGGFAETHKEEAREKMLTDLVVFGGNYLSAHHYERVIEEDRWGSPSAKLLELHLSDLSEANQNRIIQRFGHLYT